MRVITEAEFRALGKGDPYYDEHDRWGHAAKRCTEYLAWLPGKAADVLEVGAYKVALVPGCVTLDRAALAKNAGRRVVHDCTSFPWPLRERTFDVVVASHVIEHLGPYQVQAWWECCRISRRWVLIALPFRWRDNALSHRHIGLQCIGIWTGGHTPLCCSVTGKGGYLSWQGLFDLTDARLPAVREEPVA